MQAINQKLTSVTIEPVNSTHWPEFNKISLYPHQIQYVPTPKETQMNFIFKRRNGESPFELYIIKVEKKIVGFFSLVIEKDGFLWFGSFQVDRAYQNQGIGKKVLQRLFRLVIDNEKYKGIALNVQCTNKTAVRFYQQLGFHFTSLQKNRTKLLWIMKKHRNNIVENNNC